MDSELLSHLHSVLSAATAVPEHDVAVCEVLRLIHEGTSESTNALVGALDDTSASFCGGWTPMHLVCREGCVAALSAFLAAGSSVEKLRLLACPNDAGLTPLTVACFCRRVGIVRAIVSCLPTAPAFAESALWLSHNQRSSTKPGGGELCGITPMHAACVVGDYDIMQILLERGASPLSCWRVASSKGEVHRHWSTLDMALCDVRQPCSAGRSKWLRTIVSASTESTLPNCNLQSSCALTKARARALASSLVDALVVAAPKGFVDPCVVESLLKDLGENSTSPSDLQLLCTELEGLASGLVFTSAAQYHGIPSDRQDSGAVPLVEAAAYGTPISIASLAQATGDRVSLFDALCRLACQDLASVPQIGDYSPRYCITFYLNAEQLCFLCNELALLAGVHSDLQASWREALLYVLPGLPAEQPSQYCLVTDQRAYLGYGRDIVPSLLQNGFRALTEDSLLRMLLMRRQHKMFCCTLGICDDVLSIATFLRIADEYIDAAVAMDSFRTLGDGATLLDDAIKLGKCELALLLIRHRPDLIGDSFGILERCVAACLAGQVLVVRSLIPQVPASLQGARDVVSGETVLTAAAKARRSDIIASLIPLKLDPNASNVRGETALLIACREGDETSAMELAVAPKCDVNCCGPDGTTALLASLMGPNPRIAPQLIAQGANINQPDNCGMMPLVAAKYFSPSNWPSLVHAGARFLSDGVAASTSAWRLQDIHRQVHAMECQCTCAAVCGADGAVPRSWSFALQEDEALRIIGPAGTAKDCPMQKELLEELAAELRFLGALALQCVVAPTQLAYQESFRQVIEHWHEAMYVVHRQCQEEPLLSRSARSLTAHVVAVRGLVRVGWRALAFKTATCVPQSSPLCLCDTYKLIQQMQQPSTKFCEASSRYEALLQLWQRAAATNSPASPLQIVRTDTFMKYVCENNSFTQYTSWAAEPIRQLYDPTNSGAVTLLDCLVVDSLFPQRWKDVILEAIAELAATNSLWPFASEVGCRATLLSASSPQSFICSIGFRPSPFVVVRDPAGALFMRSFVDVVALAAHVKSGIAYRSGKGVVYRDVKLPLVQ